MESINQRIKRLRLACELSLEELAKRAGGRATAETAEAWECDGGSAPSRKQLTAIAAALKVSLAQLLTGVDKPKNEPKGKELHVREELLLTLYRGLFSHQQQECLEELKALYFANQYTRRDLGVTQLRGVSNETVRAAFGDVPPPLKAPARKRPPPNLRGKGGDHLGDQDVE